MKLINWIIDKLLNKFYLYQSSFSRVYTQTIVKKSVEKIIDDKALYFNTYNEYINWNLNYAKQFPNKLILEFGVEAGVTGKIISDFFPRF